MREAPTSTHRPQQITSALIMCPPCRQVWPCTVEFEFQREVNREILRSLRDRIRESTDLS